MSVDRNPRNPGSGPVFRGR